MSVSLTPRVLLASLTFSLAAWSQPSETFSLEPIFWFTPSAPQLRAGTQATTAESGNLDLPGRLKWTGGLTASMPAGQNNSLRFTYFRAGGSGDSTAASDLALFSVGFKSGDALSTAYRVHGGKLSWDYLSYTFANKMRLRTLWELQVASISADIIGVGADSTASLATGTRWVGLPTFGMAIGSTPKGRFRWDAKGSGFALPGRSAIWDVEASAAIRVGKAELIGGYKSLFLRSSPREEAYFRQLLTGPYAGIRWTWNTK